MKRKPPSGFAPPGYFTGEYAHSPEKTIKFKATGDFRQPLKGEYYLSGAIIAAYRAPNRLASCYWIAKEVEMVVCKHCGGSGRVEKGK